MWNLAIVNVSNNTRAMTPNMTAEFTAKFTMIKPDGSLSNNHIINNFKSLILIYLKVHINQIVTNLDFFKL